SLLQACLDLIQKYDLDVALGAQDISPFAMGAYTGEVNGAQIKEFADYVIVGHSERKKYFSETVELVEKKVMQAYESELQAIYCMDNSQVTLPQNLSIA